MTFREIEKPKVLSPNDVLVRIRAVSLNYRDVIPYNDRADVDHD